MGHSARCPNVGCGLNLWQWISGSHLQASFPRPQKQPVRAQMQLRTPEFCSHCFKQRNTISKCKQINSSEQFWHKSSMSTTDLPSHLLLLMPVSRVTSGFALHRGELKSSLCLSTDSLGNCQEQKRQTQGCSHLFVQAKTILVIFSTYIHEVSSQFIILLGCSYISILRQSIQINCCFTWSVGIGSWSVTDRSCFLEILTQNTNAISRT